MPTQNERVALGQRLKKAREYCGFTQDEAARFIGIPRTGISQMENGERGVDVLEMKKLASLYQCTAEELTGEAKPVSTSDIKSVELVARAAEQLSETDREEVLRFARFLKNRRRGLDDKPT
ncbi:MAG: helix-turn-helix domain-containing protein [Halobacteriales archaeon]|nr:helix-turn-helix domain-containing protein [Halobacteriales archaeon]